MKRIVVAILSFLAVYIQASGQNNSKNVITSDIDNFWIAYDSCLTTSDSLKQLEYMQILYVDKGTIGLKAFMEARDYTTERWVSLIRSYPRFWRSIRPNTLTVKQKAK
jgi:hypothetical protein